MVGCDRYSGRGRCGRSQGPIRESAARRYRPDARCATRYWPYRRCRSLFVLAAVVMIIIFWLKSDSLALNVLRVAAAAILAGLASAALPIKLRDRSVPFVVVAAGTAGLLATVLAIPSLPGQQQLPPTTTDRPRPCLRLRRPPRQPRANRIRLPQSSNSDLEAHLVRD